MPPRPEPGTRVAIRYRLPVGSVPPLNDVVGHLLAAAPLLRVQTKSGDVVEVDPADVVSLRSLPTIPVRNPDIRRLEYAAAMAWPGVEQQWLDGWLCRAGRGYTYRANSAVPLEVSASQHAVPAIVDWYSRRGLPARLACPDRLVRLPAATVTERETHVMTRDLTTGPADPTVVLADRPDDEWLRLYRRDVPADVLTAVVDGEVVFASRARRGGTGRGDRRTRRNPVGGSGRHARGHRTAGPGPRASAVFGTAGLGCRARRHPGLRADPGRQQPGRTPLRVDGFSATSPRPLRECRVAHSTYAVAHA